MKRACDEWNLRNAFSPEPDACHQALMQAARSVKEDEPVKKLSFRAVLIAAFLIVAMMAAAVAAGHMFGWSEFFGDLYGRPVPQAAQRVMGETWNRHEFVLGDVKFTTQELLCDGHIAMASTLVSMEDGSDAILCAEPFDAIGAIGENGHQAAKRLGVDPKTTWVEAARMLNRKLYAVRATLEVPAEIDGGYAMEEILWTEDGNAVYFSMPALNGKASGETIEMQLYLRAAEIDPASEQEGKVLTSREQLNVYLEAPIEEYVYECNGAFVGGGYELEGVRAELTCAGMYVYSTFTAPEGATVQDVHEREFPLWLTAEGEPIPRGISLSADVDVSKFPTITYMQMLSLDSIPDTMMIRIPDTPFVSEETINPGYQQMFLTKE